MTLLAATLLGIVQGLTEFLPVSSSAHLILARVFFGFDAGQLGLAFDVACHVGTLAAVVIYFRRDLGRMVVALPGAIRTGAGGPARQVQLVIAGTVPVAVVGLLWSGVIERSLRTPLLAAVNLVAVALLFFVVERVGTKHRDDRSVTMGEAGVIGLAQAAALVPGISRSGATIVTAMFQGLRRADAARFTFLLGVPAVLAAAAKEGLDLARAGLAPGELELFAVGAAVSAAVGYFTVKYFIRYLGDHSLRPFAWYRLGLAAAVLAWWAAGLPLGG